jgi:hypothetical protein
MAAAGPIAGFWSDGDVGTGRPATLMDEDWHNAIQEEVIAPILAAGLTPTKGVTNQLLSAFRLLAVTNFVIVGEQHPQGTDGGDPGLRGVVGRCPNTMLFDSRGGDGTWAIDVDPAGGQFTIQPGTWLVAASAPCCANNHQLGFAATGGGLQINGTSENAVPASEAYGGNRVYSRSFVSGVFTIAAATAFEFTHYTDGTASGDSKGLGRPVSNTNGAPELYGVAKFTKLG